MLITIGLPVYKNQYLALSIQSILNQTYNDFELIIINDGSPDPVEEIVRQFKDTRIKYHTNKSNLGKNDLVSIWNLVLEKASGEYFVLASDDDYYEPAFLEKMVHKAFLYPDTDIFHCRFRIVDVKGETIDVSESCSEKEDVYDFMWHRILKDRNQMVTEFMFKTSKLKQIGGFYQMPVGWGSDDITAFLMATENGIVFINEILCNWRNSGFNISTSHEFYYQKMEAIIKYQNWIMDFIKTSKPANSKNIFLLELEKRINLEFHNRLCGMSAKFLFYSPILRIPANIKICKKVFNIKISNIFGSLMESSGRKLKLRM